MYDDMTLIINGIREFQSMKKHCSQAYEINIDALSSYVYRH